MSRENVEVVRRGVEAWQRDDLEAWLPLFDPAIEWQTVARFVEGEASRYRGIDGIRQLWTFARTEIEDFHVEFQELRDLGDDRALQLGHIRWRGAASGIEVESPFGQITTLRHGKIVRGMEYLSHEEALEAVGLQEPQGQA